MKSIFASSSDDAVLYIKARYTGIPFLVQLIDRMPIVLFGKGKTPYLKVETVIAWYKNEIAELPPGKDRKKYQRLLPLLEKHYQGFCEEVKTRAARDTQHQAPEP